ncbi:hypothetical protein F5Y05DRAFT_420190 [Hypoxylon sp. FL0543]|nr:hypothetical protein F5Y05DRAFT_420190 [Hypoxylon sp. FL0543]
MDSSRDERDHSRRQSTHTSTDCIDLLALATSGSSTISHGPSLAPGAMVASNYSYTSIPPPEFRVPTLPQLATSQDRFPRSQEISSHAFSFQGPQKGHPTVSTAPVRIDGPAQPGKPGKKTPGKEAGPSLGTTNPGRGQPLPYTASHFEPNRRESASQDDHGSHRDDRRVSPSPKTPPLPYGLDLIEAENRRMSAEAKRAEREEAEREAEIKRMEAELKEDFRWPGDTSAFPAQVTEDLDVPNSKLRAKAIHVGNPLGGKSPFIGVYAIKRRLNPTIEFRMARDGSALEDIDRSPLIEFRNIRLNEYFQNMSESQVELWVRHLLATVPGTNNTVMRWR